MPAPPTMVRRMPGSAPSATRYSTSSGFSAISHVPGRRNGRPARAVRTGRSTRGRIRLRDADEAEPGQVQHRVRHRRGKPQREAGDNQCLHRDGVYDVGPLGAIRRGEAAHDAGLAHRIERGAAEVEIDRAAPSACDLVHAARTSASRRQPLMRQCLEGPQQRLEMRQREPVLGDENQHLAAPWRCSSPVHGWARLDHLCFQSALRFSTKAAMPSFWSSVANIEWNTRRSKRMPSRQRRLVGAVDALLGHHHGRQRHDGDRPRPPSAPRRAGRPPARRATTRPQRSASAASIMRPVRHISIAFDLPTKRVRRCVPPAPGMTPSLISGWPNLAVSAAMMKSHIIASSQPPPSAKPATAAMIGLRQRVMRSQVPMKSLDVGLHVGLGLHLLDVGAGGEGLLRAGQHDAADGAVGLPAVERLVQLGDQRGIERVQRLRPVERDEADPAARLDDDVLVGHRRRSEASGCGAASGIGGCAAEASGRECGGRRRVTVPACGSRQLGGCTIHGKFR